MPSHKCTRFCTFVRWHTKLPKWQSKCVKTSLHLPPTSKRCDVEKRCDVTKINLEIFQNQPFLMSNLTYKSTFKRTPFSPPPGTPKGLEICSKNWVLFATDWPLRPTRFPGESSKDRLRWPLCGPMDRPMDRAKRRSIVLDIGHYITRAPTCAIAECAKKARESSARPGMGQGTCTFRSLFLSQPHPPMCQVSLT